VPAFLGKTSCGATAVPKSEFPLAAKEALLASDIFGRTPILAALRACNVVYRPISLLNLRRSLSAARDGVVSVQFAEFERMSAG
jgi:hypothetical protein